MLSAAPSWFNDTSLEDSEYKYYLCSGEDITESLAENAALDSCYKNAIIQNYGVKTEIIQSSVETDKSTNLEVQKQFKTHNVVLKGFERIQQQYVKENNLYKAYFKYRYLKTEINKEIERIQNQEISLNLKSHFPTISHSIMNGQIGYNTQLEITTNKPLAQISLDDEVFGRGNVILSNALVPKTYKVSIEQYGFISEKKSIELKENQPLKLNFELRPKLVTIHINKTPENTRVFLPSGQEVENQFQWSYGESFSLEAKSNNCSTQNIKNVKVDTEDEITINIDLICKTTTPDKNNINIQTQNEDNSETSYQLFQHGALGKNIYLGLGAQVGGISIPYSESESKITHGFAGPAVFLSIEDAVFLEIAYFPSTSTKTNSTSTTDLMSGVSTTPQKGSMSRLRIGVMQENNSLGMGLSIFADSLNLDSSFSYVNSKTSNKTKMASTQSFTALGLSFDIFLVPRASYNLKSKMRISIDAGQYAVDNSDSITFYGISLSFCIGKNI